MRFLLLYACFLCPSFLLAQIRFSIELQDDEKTYIVKLKPEATYKSPKNMTNSAQVSLVVPKTDFEVGNLQNFIGKWENNNTIIAPPNNPNFNYITFNLVGYIKNIDYVQGEEINLFSFENIGTSNVKPRFVNARDVKSFKNQRLNIGNQITVFGAGLRNAYVGIYHAKKKSASKSDIVRHIPQSNAFDLDLNVEIEGILLNWLAENKEKTKFYVIEKSMDGEAFEPIQVIEELDSELSFIDDAPDYGTNYYRIKQEFKDGTAQYSTVKSENYLVDEQSLNIYPNPVKDYLNIKLGHFSEVRGQLRIFSISGLEMISKPIQTNQLRIDAQDFQNGIYFLLIEGADAQIYERQFIVEHGQ